MSAVTLPNSCLTNAVLMPSGVSAGSYQAANISVNAQGIVVSAANGAAGSATGVAITASGSSAANGVVEFANSNSITFGMSGSTVTASFAGGGAVGTGTTFAGTNVSGSMTLGAAGLDLALSVAAAGGAQTAISGISAGAAIATSGTVSFANSNGLAFGLNGNTLTGSYTVPSLAGLLSAINVSAGTTSNNLSAFTLSNANSVSFGLAGSVVTASISTSQSVQTQASGNIAGIGTTFNGANLSGSITLNSAGLQLSLSGPTESGIGLSAAGSSQTAGNLVLSNSNGISFGMNGSTITASYTVPNVPAQSTQPVAVSGSNGSFAFSTLTMGNLNGLSHYTSNGSLVGSYTVPSTTGLAGTGTTFNGANVSGSITLNSSGLDLSLSVAAPAGAQTAISGIVVSNTTYTSGTVSFSNANGISFGSSAGQAITASYNSTQFAGSGTTFNGANVSGSLTLNSAGLNLSLSGPTESGVGISAAGSSQTAGNIVFSNSNGVSFGMNGSTVTATVATNYQSQGAYLTTAAQSNQVVNSLNGSTGQISLAVGSSLSSSTNGSSITFGLASNITTALQSSGAYLTTARASTDAIGLNTAQTNVTWTVNSSGISLNAGGYAGTGFTTASTLRAGFTGTQNTAGLSLAMPYLTRLIVPAPNDLSAVGALGNASASFQYVPVEAPVTGSRIDLLVSWSAATAANTSTCGIALSAYACIYTRNASTLSSLSSGSTQQTISYGSNNLGQSGFTSPAVRPISVPVNFNLVPGEYFVGFNMVTATSAINANSTNLGQTISIMGGHNQFSQAYASELTSGIATSFNLLWGQGIYSAATTGLAASYGLASLNQTGSAQSQANIGLVFRNG